MKPAVATGPMVGAHMSVAGGLHNAVIEAARYRCRAVQIFSKSSNQWAARTLTDEDLAAWNDARARHPMVPIVHDSYLINLASPDPALLERSRAAFLEEVRRCDLLDIPLLVFHPGADMGAGEDEGLARIAASLDWVCERDEGSATMLLLETTAGQGTSLGHRIEHLAGSSSGQAAPNGLASASIRAMFSRPATTSARRKDTMRSCAESTRCSALIVLRCFHVNDSKKDLGSRVDRHEHIGKGFVGTAAFGSVMRDPRFVDVPKILETPKDG